MAENHESLENPNLAIPQTPGERIIAETEEFIRYDQTMRDIAGPYTGDFQPLTNLKHAIYRAAARRSAKKADELFGSSST